jgi:thioredoxin reductase
MRRELGRTQDQLHSSVASGDRDVKTEVMEKCAVAVVGGGPAGLQAALTLGRMHVRTVVFDHGRYRNASSPAMHNMLSRDGVGPLELRTAAHEELRAYPWVHVMNVEVNRSRREEAVFVLTAGGAELEAERLVIASGVEDLLLPIDGLAELWGDLVLPCPYCHGHEFSGGPIAVISAGAHAEHVGGLLRGVTDSVPVIAPDLVRQVRRSAMGVAIELMDGSVVEAGCVFIPPNAHPRTLLAEQLDVKTEAGGILVDALGRTDQPGIWAAGDVVRRQDTRIPASVVTAMASGLIAAADIAADLAASREHAGN